MIENVLSISFKDKELIKQALTHPSLSRKGSDYERMEFLGDHVLGLVIAEELYHRFKDENEGQMTKRLAGLICGETLVKVAKKLMLGDHIRMAQSEESAGGRVNKANLENAMEAVIGAIFLDQGMEVAKRFIISIWRDLIDNMLEPPKDAKSSLQEWAQGRGLPLPEYEVVSTEGAMHAPVFKVKVTVKDEKPFKGEGLSKRAAEQQAAAKLLEHLSKS